MLTILPEGSSSLRSVEVVGGWVGERGQGPASWQQFRLMVFAESVLYVRVPGGRLQSRSVWELLSRWMETREVGIWRREVIAMWSVNWCGVRMWLVCTFGVAQAVGMWSVEISLTDDILQDSCLHTQFTRKTLNLKHKLHPFLASNSARPSHQAASPQRPPNSTQTTKPKPISPDRKPPHL